MGGTGLEGIDVSVDSGSGSENRSNTGGAESGARTGECDPLLAEIVERWPMLSQVVRQALVAIVRGERAKSRK